tara:strand:- start:856 stop:1083 length:228 start_codon:yes stop_codon:yes gene_type:complete
MKKILVFSLSVFMASWAFGSDLSQEMDAYYATVDKDTVQLAAYNGNAHNDDSGRETKRKRAHRRKRTIRPPVQGK